MSQTVKIITVSFIVVVLTCLSIIIVSPFLATFAGLAVKIFRWLSGF